MGKSLREATDERLGEGAYERLLTEAIEENRYSFSPTIGWEERRSFARNMLFELCRADGVPDVPAIAEDVIVDSYCAPEGPLDLACNEAARTLCDKLKAAGIEEDFDELWWPDAVFDVRDHDLVYSKGYFDLGEIYDALVPAEIKVDLCLGDYSHADDPTGRFSTLLAEGNLAGAAAWAHDPDNRADMAHNPIVMLLASQGHTVDDLCDPKAHTPFLDSLREEVVDTTNPDTCVVAFLLKVSVEELAEGWSDEGCVTVLDGGQQVACGLFSPEDGSGGPLGIVLDKPLEMSLSETPAMVLYEDAGKGVNGYCTVDEAYGLVPEAWRHGTAVVASSADTVTPHRAYEQAVAVQGDGRGQHLPSSERATSGLSGRSPADVASAARQAAAGASGALIQNSARHV